MGIPAPLLAEDVAAFEYPRLQRNSEQIRLIKIEPGALNEQIICTLEPEEISRTAPENSKRKYIALSYTWGPPLPQKEILINGARFTVRQNLWDFLIVARQNLSSDLYWIDQICINEESNDEKNHQIRLMSQIYENASLVHIWLGSATDDSDLAIDYIEWKRSTLTRQKKDLLRFSFTTQRTKNAIQHLFSRPYWSRLWVIQEVKLARDIYVLCGRKKTPWHLLKGFVEQQAGRKGIRSGLISLDAALLVLGHGIRYVRDTHPMFVNEYEYNRGSHQRLRQNIYMYCHSQCTDPRDKIYAFKGLLGEDNRSSSAIQMTVDYNKTVEEVFWDFFASSSSDFLQENSARHGRSDKGPHFPAPLPEWYSFGVTLMQVMGFYAMEKEQAIIDLLNKTEERIGVSPNRLRKDGIHGQVQQIRLPGFENFDIVKPAPPSRPKPWSRGGSWEKGFDKFCAAGLVTYGETTGGHVITRPYSVRPTRFP
jgi:hypothetical protein